MQTTFYFLNEHSLDCRSFCGWGVVHLISTECKAELKTHLFQVFIDPFCESFLLYGVPLI